MSNINSFPKENCQPNGGKHDEIKAHPSRRKWRHRTESGAEKVNRALWQCFVFQLTCCTSYAEALLCKSVVLMTRIDTGNSKEFTPTPPLCAPLPPSAHLQTAAFAFLLAAEWYCLTKGTPAHNAKRSLTSRRHTSLPSLTSFAPLSHYPPIFFRFIVLSAPNLHPFAPLTHPLSLFLDLQFHPCLSLAALNFSSSPSSPCLVTPFLHPFRVPPHPSAFLSSLPRSLYLWQCCFCQRV